MPASQDAFLVPAAAEKLVFWLPVVVAKDELAQLGFSFVFANSVSGDFEEDIENINYYMTKYKPAFEKSSDYKFPEIDPDFILSVRKFINIYEIRKAAQTATIPRLETAQFIWKTFCLVIGQLGPEEQRSEIGLTPARRLQGAFAGRWSSR
jgi:hypothetical protein